MIIAGQRCGFQNRGFGNSLRKWDSSQRNDERDDCGFETGFAQMSMRTGKAGRRKEALMEEKGLSKEDVEGGR